MRKLFITIFQVQVFYGHRQRADPVHTSILKNSSSSANDQKLYVRIPIPGILMTTVIEKLALTSILENKALDATVEWFPTDVQHYTLQ